MARILTLPRSDRDAARLRASQTTMTRLVLVPVATSAGLLALACANTPPREGLDVDADVGAIRSIIQGAVAAHRGGDAQWWREIVTPDAVVLPEGAPEVVGREEIVASMRELYEALDVDLEIRPLEIQVAGDWAFSRNRISGTMTPKDGSPALPVEWKHIVIFQRRSDGSWAVARSIYNSNHPPGAVH